MRTASPVVFHDPHPAAQDLQSLVLRGLEQPQKELPRSLLYDERGPELFEAITRLPEHYLTRADAPTTFSACTRCAFPDAAGG